jgi:SAM-dependent methyltransferase
VLEPEPFIVAALRRYVDAPGRRVIDIGCGPGLYRNATSGEYIGVDQMPDPYPGASHVDVVAPADCLPFDDMTADLIYTKSALYQFSDPDGALREFYRVLRRGGRVVLFDYNRRVQKLLERTEHAKRPKWTALGLRRRVRRAGFRNVELLLPREVQPTGLERVARLALEELRGEWAIVTGIRPA